jgi:hypothetical protein
VKKIIAAVAISALLGCGGLGALIYLAVSRAYRVDPPLAGYAEATHAECGALGRRVVEGLEARDAAPFDEALDLDAIVRQGLADVPMSRDRRARFVAGFRKGVEQKGGSLGNGLVKGLDPRAHVRLLRCRVGTGGRREAIVRLLMESGVNYLALSVLRDPAGRSASSTGTTTCSARPSMPPSVRSWTRGSTISAGPRSSASRSA